MFVNDIASLVDNLAFQRRQISDLFLRLFVWLCVALDIAIFVNDISILIDGAPNESLSVTLDDNTDDVAIFVLDPAVFDNDTALEAGKWTLWLSFTLVFRNELTTANNLAGIVPNLAFFVALPTSKLFGVTFDKSGNWDTLGANDVALLVDRQPFEDGEIRLLLSLLLRLFIAVSVTDHIATLVKDVAILVYSPADKLLRIALGQDTNLILVLIFDPSIRNNNQPL